MTHQESELAPTAPNLEKPGTGTELYGQQEPRQYAYDPSAVPILTAKTLEAIEDELVMIEDPEVAKIRMIELLGENKIDASLIQNGAMVVDFIGVDGKENVRAVVMNPYDFGTHIRNSVLNPQEATVANKTDPETLGELSEPAVEDIEDKEFNAWIKRTQESVNEYITEADMTTRRSTEELEVTSENLTRRTQALKRQLEDLQRMLNRVGDPRQLQMQLEEMLKSVNSLRGIVADNEELSRFAARKNIELAEGARSSKNSLRQLEGTSGQNPQMALAMTDIEQYVGDLVVQCRRSSRLGDEAMRDLSMLANQIHQVMEGQHSREDLRRILSRADQNFIQFGLEHQSVGGAVQEASHRLRRTLQSVQ